MRVPMSWLNSLLSQNQSRNVADVLLGEAGITVSSVDVIGDLNSLVVVGEVVELGHSGCAVVRVPSKELVSLDKHARDDVPVGSKVAVALPGALLFARPVGALSEGFAGVVRVPKGRGPGRHTGQVCLGVDIGRPDRNVVRLPQHAVVGSPAAHWMHSPAGEEVLMVRVPNHLAHARSLRGLAQEVAARSGCSIVPCGPTSLDPSGSSLTVEAPGTAAAAIVIGTSSSTHLVDRTTLRRQELASLGGMDTLDRAMRAAGFEYGVRISAHPASSGPFSLSIRTADDHEGPHPGLTLAGIDASRAARIPDKHLMLVATSLLGFADCLPALLHVSRLVDREPIHGAVGSGPSPARRRVDLDLATFSNTIGGSTSLADVTEILSRIGAEVRPLDATNVEVTVPHGRDDLVDDMTLVNELVRLVGIGHLPQSLPRPLLDPPATTRQDDAVRSGLREMGFYELITPLIRTSPRPADSDPLSMSLRTPSSAAVRSSLVYGLAEAIIGQGTHESLRAFELGTVVVRESIGGQGIEKRILTAASIGAGDAPDEDHVEALVASARSLFASLGRSHPLQLVPTDDARFRVGTAAQLLAGDHHVGCVGVVSVAAPHHGAPQREVTAVEIDLDRFFALAPKYSRAKQPPRFPIATRDLCFETPNEVNPHLLLETISSVEAIVSSVDIVDVHHRTSAERPTRFITFRMALSSPWRTIPKPEAADVVNLAITACEALGASVRR